MKILITGITGMIGKHLADYLISLGRHEVSGISRSTSDARYKNYKHYLGDILDRNFLRKVWKDFQPQVVYHLAGYAFNGTSWENEDTVYLFNIQGTRNILDMVKDYSPNAIFIPACSSTEYGFCSISQIPETAPLNPITPYGVSKVCVENICKQYSYNYELIVIIARLFIHIGINHPPVTAVQNLARQFAMIKLGIGDGIVRVGNLKNRRDFVDVRDGVEALYLLQQKGKIREAYNICTGYDYSILDILYMFSKITGINPEIKTDYNLLRLSDEETLLGDPSKINALGWKAHTPIENTLTDIYNNWIERLKYKFYHKL